VPEKRANEQVRKDTSGGGGIKTQKRGSIKRKEMFTRGERTEKLDQGITRTGATAPEFIQPKLQGGKKNESSTGAEQRVPTGRGRGKEGTYAGTARRTLKAMRRLRLKSKEGEDGKLEGGKTWAGVRDQTQPNSLR